MQRRIEGCCGLARSTTSFLSASPQKNIRHSQCSKKRNHSVLDEDRSTDSVLFGYEHEVFANGVRLKVAVIATHRNKESGGSLKYLLNSLLFIRCIVVLRRTTAYAPTYLAYVTQVACTHPACAAGMASAWPCTTGFLYHFTTGLSWQ